MTSAEITALRIEFEDAILTACNDFKAKTGVSVRQIYLQTIEIERFGCQTERAITRVNIDLYSL
jgi:hypothetical protein